jgi:hypothetical protein
MTMKNVVCWEGMPYSSSKNNVLEERIVSIIRGKNERAREMLAVTSN